MAGRAPEPLAGRFPGALFHPDDGSCSRRGSSAGWRLQPRRPASRSASTIRVEDLDELKPDTVVVATDGYPSGLLGELRRPDHPDARSDARDRAVAGALFPLPHYGRHGYDYWHQDEEGRLIVGGFRDADMDSEFTAGGGDHGRIQGALDGFVESLLGRRPRITHRWAGVFGLVPDLMPVVGPVPGRDGLWVAGGYSGHGNVLGLMCGDLVARAILGEPTRCSSDGPGAPRRLTLGYSSSRRRSSSPACS